MDKYTIVIMDYAFGSLRFYHFDNKPEDPEEWIRTHDEAWSDSTWRSKKTASDRQAGGSKGCQ